MQKIIDYLNDPLLVARTQNYFHLKLVDVVTDENSTNTQTTNTQTTNSTSLKHVKSVNHLDNKKCLYSIGNYFYYYFFLFITNIGNEIFYISFLPFLTWNYDDKVMILTCMAWAITMYIGQATKDILKIPRPSTPPVVKIEDRYLQEYGFPSTHAMAVFTISWTLLTFMFKNPILTDHFALKLTLTLLSYVLIFFVCLSRVYLGMHSYMDIFGGLIFAYIINTVFISFSDSIYNVIHDNFLSGFMFSSMFLIICFVYPNKTRWSSARADTFLIMGVGTGLSFGMTCKSVFGLEDMGKINFMRNENELSLFLIVILRTIIGLVLLVLVRFVSKDLFYFVLRKYYNLKDSITKTGVKEFIKTDYKIEIAYNFFCYSSVSFSSVFNAFLIFQIFNIV